ncbi:MAG: phosphoesterase [Clostridia bacterium]|nr:phosphoesterase [Clostridia bacterium]
MIDMHVHILPGVDDGAKDADMTRAMMRRAADAGITFIIATPHVYRPEDQLRNRGALRLARNIAHEHGALLNMGCEFNYRALRASGTKDLDGFCLSGTRCLLLEFANDHLMPRWDAVISEIMDNGYLPIIAHPERYSYIQRDFGIAQEMSDLGCEMQVDACGLMAGLLSAERRTARKLLKEGLVSYIASDAHTPEDYDDFEKAYRTFRGEWPRGSRLTAQLRAQRKE